MVNGEVFERAQVFQRGGRENTLVGANQIDEFFLAIEVEFRKDIIKEENRFFAGLVLNKKEFRHFKHQNGTALFSARTGLGQFFFNAHLR